MWYHDTVVVPRLGTFKTTYVPSKWVEEEEILLPPYRALTFTHEVDETDTHFIKTISSNYQISTEEAYIVTLEFTENIQQELSEYGSYELGSIGEFVKEEETGKVQFIPCHAGVASPRLYGLDAIHAHLTKEEVLATRKQGKKKNVVNTDAKHVTISINKHLLHYAASVAAAIVLFFAFSTPISDSIINNKHNVSRSELFIPANIISELQEKTTSLVEKNEASETPDKEVSVNSDAETATEKVQNVDITYAVVLCCGVPLENAEIYCRSLNQQGIKAIVDNSGKFLRVLIPGFTSKEDALTEVRTLRSKSKEFSNAWVMEKK